MDKLDFARRVTELDFVCRVTKLDFACRVTKLDFACRVTKLDFACRVTRLDFACRVTKLDFACRVTELDFACRVTKLNYELKQSDEFLSCKSHARLTDIVQSLLKVGSQFFALFRTCFAIRVSTCKGILRRFCLFYKSLICGLQEISHQKTLPTLKHWVYFPPIS